MDNQTNPNFNKVLFVGSLADEVTPETLQAAFIPFGPIKTVELPTDRIKGNHKGFGFVEFEEEEDTRHALENMNNSELFGRIIKVNIAKPTTRLSTNTNKPIWADDFFYRQQLAEEGIEVDQEGLDKTS